MIRSVTREELREKIERHEPLRLIDVRMRDTCELEHIKGAECVPFGELVEKAEGMFEKDEQLVVYCGSSHCADSPAAAKLLEGKGFMNVCEFDGGIENWKEARFPVERSESRH